MRRTNHRPSTTDLALLVLAAAAVSTSAPLVRAAAAPTLAIAFWRDALALPVVGGIVVTTQRERLRRITKPEVRLSVVAGVLLALHFAAWVPSVSFTSVASSVALVSTMPVWSAVIDRMRGEPVRTRAWAGIALALGGVVLLTGVDVTVSARALFGDVLALAGGVLAALYVHAGAEVRRTVSTSIYASICYGAAAALLLVVCVVGGQELVGYPASTWLALLAITAGPQLLGHTVVNRVLATTGPTVVSIMILLEIVGATILAWVFFDEAPPLLAYPAAAMIVAGVVAVVSARTPSPEPLVA
ncbi:MAG: DMT family transporter [Acidimicrobiales bacterium]